MNVFDNEAGPVATAEELETLLFLMAVGLSLEEYRAYMGMLEKGQVN